MVAFGQVIPVLPGSPLQLAIVGGEAAIKDVLHRLVQRSPLQLAILGVEAAIKDVPTQVSTEESATASYCRR